MGMKSELRYKNKQKNKECDVLKICETQVCSNTIIISNIKTNNNNGKKRKADWKL